MIVIATVGCGGGGGGSNPPAKETRSANVATATFGSQYLKTHNLLVQWVGDKTGTNYGTCKIESVNKTSGTGTLSVNPDGSISLINDLPADVFNFTFVTHHPPIESGDPQYDQLLTGTATITIVPESTSTNPTNFNIPQGGQMTLVARAQNARATGAEVVRVTAADTSRVPVNVEATWVINPPNAGNIVKNTGETTYTFTGAAAFTGTFTLTAHIANAMDQPAAVNGNAIAHPTIGVSNPTEGQTVSGTVTVQFAAQNATSVYWKVDSGTEMLASSNSFPLDTTTLSNANHTLNFRAVGQLETVTLSRAFTVNNQVPYDPGKAGKLTFTGGTYNTNSDNSGKMVSTFYMFKTGGAVAVDKADTIRFFNAAGTVVNTVQTADYGYPVAVTSGDVVWAVRRNFGQVRLLNKTGAVVNTLTVAGANDAAYVAQTGKVLVSGNNGIREYDPNTLAYTQLRTDRATAVTGDDRYVFYQGTGDGSDPTMLTIWKLDRTTGSIVAIAKPGILFSLYSPPGFNCVVGTDGTSKTVKVWDKSGGLLSSTPLPNGEQVVGIGVDMSGDGSGLFITPDISLFQYRAQIVPN